MDANPGTSEVLFDIADVSFNWWFCWPAYIFILAIAAFIAIGYALCETLEKNARWILQRGAFVWGATLTGLLMVLVVLITGLDWLAFHKQQVQRQRGNLQSVEGDFMVGKPVAPPEYGSSGPADEPMVTFIVKSSDNQKHEFVWMLTRGKSFKEGLARMGKRDRLRVKFVPTSRTKVQRALVIEKVSSR